MRETDKVGVSVREKLELWSAGEEALSMFDPIIRVVIVRRFGLVGTNLVSLGIQLSARGVLTADEACWLDDLD